MKIVAFPFHDWNKCQREGFRTRDGHLMQEVLRRRDVETLIVVNRPVSMAERILKRRFVHSTHAEIAARTSSGCRATLSQIAEGALSVDVEVPDVLGPLRSPRAWWFDIFSEPRVVDLIRWALDQARADTAPIIAWVPTVTGTVKMLHPSRLVFDSLDNWLLHPVLRRESTRARKAYSELLPLANEVFVSAPRSATAFREWRKDVNILPNGVDSAVFRDPAQRPDDLPEVTTVGYAGKLAHRIDTELVRDVATRLNHLAFVFVGPVLDEGSVRPLRNLPNVFLLGDRSYIQLPAYLQHFDVAWIPHRVGEGETGGDPIKLYEYWAAGRPVVSTRIDGMDQWADSLALVSSTAEAIEAIERMLVHPVVPPVPPEREWSSIAATLVQALAGGGR